MELTAFLCYALWGYVTIKSAQSIIKFSLLRFGLNYRVGEIYWLCFVVHVRFDISYFVTIFMVCFVFIYFVNIYLDVPFCDFVITGSIYLFRFRVKFEVSCGNRKWVHFNQNTLSALSLILFLLCIFLLFDYGVNNINVGVFLIIRVLLSGGGPYTLI